MKGDAMLSLLATVCEREGHAYFRIGGNLYGVMPVADRPHVRVVQPLPAPAQMAPDLTPRQMTALELSAQGMSPGQIAQEQGTSRNTVHQHLQAVRRAFRVRRTSEAVDAARALGMLP